jgi:hypothetical protein
MPAKAGIQLSGRLDSRFRGHDENPNVNRRVKLRGTQEANRVAVTQYLYLRADPNHS